VKQYSRLS